MRPIASFTYVLVFWCLLTVSPAQALFFTLEHDLGGSFGSGNPGTISYAGGTAPLVGSNITINFIHTAIPVPADPGLTCVLCTLSFSTGPSVPTGTTSYAFSGGGSFQITGGATGTSFLDGTPFMLPAGTTLFSSVPTSASVSPALSSFYGPRSIVGINSLGTLNSSLASFFGLPGGSYASSTFISTTELSFAPNPFVLSTFQFGECCGDLAWVHVASVPEPATLWMLAGAFVALAGWWQLRKAVFL
jgi:hypothetical protein